MAGATKKATGYIQVKLIPDDRNSQTWTGWCQRWVDLLVVSEDSGRSKREKIPEVWLEVRKSKNSGKPIKVWTVDAKDTVLYRCTSKRKAHAFAIQYRKKDIVYLSGNSEGESNDWMKIVRECLWPTDKIVELEISTERLFEASVIDNSYSASCGLFGKYGHLSCRENKLIMFDNNGSNVIQEWYLHTIRKMEAFKASANDKGQVLTIYLGENSSTGCGVVYFFCPKAVSLLKSIRTRIRDVFNDLADDKKVQQATLMSLGALHDVSLEESEVKEPLMNLIIADEIIKAKQDLSQSKRLQALKPTVQEATNKNEPFIWKDNELFEEDTVKAPLKADYTPPDEEPPKKPRRASLTQSLSFMKRPRARSTTPDDSARPRREQRRGSLPQSARFFAKSPTKTFENDMKVQLQKFQQILNLADSENSEKIFPVVGSPKNLSRPESSEVVAQETTTLSALDECSEGTTSRSVSLSSFTAQLLIDDKPMETADSTPDNPISADQQLDSTSGVQAETENPKTDNEDSLSDEPGNITAESIVSADDAVFREPELDLRLRESDEDQPLDNTDRNDDPALAKSVAYTESTRTAERLDGGSLSASEEVTDLQGVPPSPQDEPTSGSSNGKDALDSGEPSPATADITSTDRKGSSHAVKINFGPPPKPKRISRNSKEL
ncbi:uncharacterized protein LOC100906646 [Galendromus occidentalis]|uniref:Uncharacterized protein LOC100906646 n=1 Tax=Galendromus occidentalis TaxID=34638 RepID=A0AAJ6QTI0_9ACAR|nr:uncharacterized protein LOC100906646 [Galendromus occidentalis]